MATIAIATRPGATATATATPVIPQRPIMASQVTRVSLQVILMLIAAMFLAIGLAILTSPLAIPLTILLWLCAAASTGLGVFGLGRLAEDK
jgi:hypothetical protein